MLDDIDARRKRLILLGLGAVGPIVFIATYLINGTLQPGYSSWHDSISTLSLAPYGWIQVLNFMLYGLLTLCFAEGLRRSGISKSWGFALLVIAGLGLLAIGPFRTDPVLGFPNGESSTITAVGTVHSTASLVVFLTFPAAVLVTARRSSRGWLFFSIATSILSLAAVALFFGAVTAANGHAGGDSPAGLYERLPTVLIGVWQVLFVLRVIRNQAKPGNLNLQE